MSIPKYLLTALSPFVCTQIAAQTAIDYGEVHLSSVACNGTTQFTFTGQVGDRIVIHTTETADFGGVCGAACCCFDQRIELVDPLGSVFDTAESPTSNNVCGASGRFRTVLGPTLLPSSGTYTIRVRDKQNNGRGSFTLVVQSTNRPENDIAIGSSASLTMPLAPSGAVDTYTFLAGQGDQIGAVMTTLTGTLNARLDLYGPDGLAVDLPGSGAVQGIAQSGGVYTLLAYSKVDEQGTYDLGVTIQPGAVQVLYPGTGEDLVLSMGVNAQYSQFPDMQTATQGDLLTLHLDSPLGTLMEQPFAIVGQAFLTGTPPIGPSPDLHFSFSTFPKPLILFDGFTPTLIGAPVIPFGGVTLTYAIPPGLAGASVMVQAVSFSAGAINGAYSSTHGHEVRFL